MTWRTLHPWGHVSRANRAARYNLSRKLCAYGKILQKEGAEPLYDELEEIEKKFNDENRDATQEEKKRIEELFAALNEKGIDDETVYTALGE